MMTILPALMTGVLILVLGIAVITDICARKIPNWLTFPAMALGIVLNSLHGGMAGFGSALGGIGVACLALLLLLIGGMGAGDVKLLWAVGALAGPHFALWTLLCTAILGGVLGLAYALRRGALQHTVANALVGSQALLASRSPDSLHGMAALSQAGRMPYAPAIALGAAAAALLIHSGYAP